MKQKSKLAQKGPLFAILLLGFTGAIQTTDPIISSIGLVNASKALGFSADTTALASSISTLALAATVVATGLLADRIGRRRLLMIALVTAIVGDVMVAASTNAQVYLTGRVIAGIGLGAVFAASFAYIRTIAAGSVGSALGKFGAMGGLTTMVAGFVGGTIVSVSWRLAYLVVPVLCLISLLLVPIILPKVPRVKNGRIDYAGLILIAFAATGILYGVSQASASLTAISTWLPIVIGLTSLIGFVVVEKRSSHAIFPAKLFKSPVFLAAALSVLVWNFAQAIIILQLSNLWQYVEHYSPAIVTAGQLPFSIVAIVASVMAGRSMAKGRTARSCILFGLGMAGLGFASLALLPLGSMYWVYLPALVLVGWGLPYVIVASGQLYMSEAPAKSFGPVTSSKTTVGQFGYALGLAGSMVLVGNLTAHSITRKLIDAGASPFQTGQGLDAVTAYLHVGDQPSTEVGRQALQAAGSAYTDAFAITMLVAATICVVAGIAAYLILQTPAARRATSR